MPDVKKVPLKPKEYQVLVSHNRGTSKFKVKATSSAEASRLARNQLPRGVQFIYSVDAVELARLGGRKTRTVYMLKVISSTQTASKRVDNLIIGAAGKKPYVNETGLADRELSFIYGERAEARIAKKRVERLKIRDLSAEIKVIRLRGEAKISSLALIREMIRTELKNLLD